MTVFYFQFLVFGFTLPGGMGIELNFMVVSGDIPMKKKEKKRYMKDAKSKKEMKESDVHKMWNFI